MGKLNNFWKRMITRPPKRGMPQGSSGTQIYSGYLQEEYLGTLLNNRDRYEVFDKMERSDGTISMCLRAYEETLLSAKWGYKIKDGFDEEDPIALAQIELMEKLFDKKEIIKFMNNVISFAKHGNVLFDRFFKPVEIEGQLRLSPRFKYMSPWSIQQWITDEAGELKGVYQQSSNDDPYTGFIPVERLTHFAVRRRGNNFEGISLIRPCYGPWVRKNANYDNVAIMNRQLSIPFLSIINEDGSVLSKEDEKEFKNRLAARYSEDEVLMHIVFPPGFKAESIQTNGDPEKLYKCNDNEDVQIIRAFCANFLMLGSGSSGTGSFALGNSLAKFFVRGIENNAKEIDALLDKELVEKTIKLNLDQECMIEIYHSEIDKEGGDKFAVAVTNLLNSKAITRDEKLETHIRNKFDLPRADIDTREEPILENPTPEPTGTTNKEDEDKDDDDIAASSIHFSRKRMQGQAKRAMQRIEALRNEVSSVYEIDMIELVNKKVAKIVSFWRAHKNSQKLYDLTPEDFQISSISTKNKLVQKAGTVYDSETDDLNGAFGISLAKEPSESSKRKIVKAIVIADIADFSRKIDRALLMTFYDQIENAEDKVAVTALLTKAGSDVVGQTVSAKSSVIPSKTVNNARETVFKKKSDQIESYTFYNNDPKSEICRYLNKKTVTLSEKKKWQEPFHYNCKTVSFVNLKNFTDNPPPESLRPNKKQLDSVDFGVKGRS